MPDDYITVTEARELLGVSKVKIARMIRDGELVTVPDKRDARVKLVKRSDVEKIMQSPTRTREEDDSPKIDALAA
jgi:excisionase family DNA binding protein